MTHTISVSVLIEAIMTGSANPIILALLAVSLIVIAVLSFFIYKLRKRLAKECHRSRNNEEIKSSFLTHISKALRMPLKSINENCKALENKEEPVTADQQKELIHAIHQSSHQMFTYLNELQELTNFDGAIPALATIEVNLAELIMSYRREILHETHRGVMVGIQSTMSPHCKATMDTTLFRQLIMHLLRIMAKRTTEGSLTIRYDWEREGLHFWLEDTGGGLPDVYKGVIFKDMLPEDHVLPPACQEIALNLRICKSIIDSMRGTIEAYSSEEEKGVVISFWFPCHIKFS